MSAKRSLTEPLETETPVSQNRPTGRFFRPPGKKAPPPLEEKALAFKFLLQGSDNEVGNFELVKLSEVANLRKDMLAMFDKLVDSASLAVLAAMLRRIDRQELVRQLLKSPDTTISNVLSEAREQIRNAARSHEEAEEYEEDGQMPSNWGIFRPKLPPAEARKRRLESIKRYGERNIAEGKCRKCPRPLCPESIEYCEKHLAMRREAQRKRKGAVHAHGRHPNTSKALKEANEERKKG